MLQTRPCSSLERVVQARLSLANWCCSTLQQSQDREARPGMSSIRYCSQTQYWRVSGMLELFIMITPPDSVNISRSPLTSRVTPLGAQSQTTGWRRLGSHIAWCRNETFIYSTNYWQGQTYNYLKS